MVWRNLVYIRTHLRPHICATATRFSAATAARSFESFGGQVHRWLSSGRWLIFLIPTVLPLAHLMSPASQWSDHGILYLFIIPLDIIVTILLFFGVVAGYREHSRAGNLL
jgi:hypothetical protein